jgi:hypothetical protein
MKERKQSSTSYPMTFLLVSSTDHVTPVTGITPTVTISKDGASFASPSGTVSEIGNGWYKLAGNATDRNTLGTLLLHATGTGADPADDRYVIVPWDPFDGAAMGLTNLDTNVASRSTFAGGAVASVTAAVTVGTNNDKSGYSLSVTPPTAVQVRQEIDANSTQLAAIVTKTTNLPADPASQATVLAAIPSAATIAAAVGSLVIEGSYSLINVLRGIASACLGKSTNGGLTYRDTADTKDRITATTDGAGNRTGVSLNLS